VSTCARCPPIAIRFLSFVSRNARAAPCASSWKWSKTKGLLGAPANNVVQRTSSATAKTIGNPAYAPRGSSAPLVSARRQTSASALQCTRAIKLFIGCTLVAGAATAASWVPWWTGRLVMSRLYSSSMGPNPSIEGTSTSGLRPLAVASHVKS
jgi:hypothetical protein